jgi:hypothetical protein
MLRFAVLFLAAVMLTGVIFAAGQPAFAGSLYAQYYPPGYGYPPPSSRPPCEAITPGPLRGAGRGAAGGALIGAISGMPGGALQSGPASALSAVQYVGVRRAVRAHVIEAVIACRRTATGSSGFWAAGILNPYREPKP